ncbi:Uncharacterised protein [Vibrio cholerae]|nr:Uncharacterised protein [Vibrio cholerae]
MYCLNILPSLWMVMVVGRKRRENRVFSAIKMVWLRYEKPSLLLLALALKP